MIQNIKNIKNLKQLKKASIEELNLMKQDLKLGLFTAYSTIKGLGFHPIKGAGGASSPTNIVNDFKKQIARINTILNQKVSLKESIERNKDKHFSKRRERRLRGKMKELEVL